MQWQRSVNPLLLEAAVAGCSERAALCYKYYRFRASLHFICFKSEYSRLLPLFAIQLSVPVLIGCGGGITGMAQPGQMQELEGFSSLEP